MNSKVKTIFIKKIQDNIEKLKDDTYTEFHLMANEKYRKFNGLFQFLCFFAEREKKPILSNKAELFFNKKDKAFFMNLKNIYFNLWQFENYFPKFDNDSVKKIPEINLSGEELHLFNTVYSYFDSDLLNANELNELDEKNIDLNLIRICQY